MHITGTVLFLRGSKHLPRASSRFFLDFQSNDRMHMTGQHALCVMRCCLPLLRSNLNMLHTMSALIEKQHVPVAARCNDESGHMTKRPNCSEQCTMYTINNTKSQVSVNDLLELVIGNQHQSTSSTTQNVGASTLEESLATLL